MGRRLSDQEIVRLYRERQSLCDVGLAAGCSAETVRAIVSAAGEPIRKVGGGNRGMFKAYALSYEEIARRYRAGVGMPALAEQAGACVSQIKHILERSGVPIRSSRQANALLRRRRRSPAPPAT